MPFNFNLKHKGNIVLNSIEINKLKNETFTISQKKDTITDFNPLNVDFELLESDQNLKCKGPLD